MLSTGRSISHMSRMVGAATARLRLAIALVVGGAFALLMPSLLATTMDAPAVVLAALALALAAVVGLSSHIATPVPRSTAPPPHAADEVTPFLAGRVTDPLHHPLRPRAPGLV